MNFLTFTPAERRALLLLGALVLVGLGVQGFHRYLPGSTDGYRIEFDTLSVREVAPAPDVAISKLDSGINPNLAPAQPRCVSRI